MSGPNAVIDRARDSENSILHVIVVGFHHRYGPQVEFCYPPIHDDVADEALSQKEVILPEKWKHISQIAFPDGAHKSKTGSVFFLLPSLDDTGEVVYGVACFDCISTEDLDNKKSDMIRNHVQKSVCVLSRLPMFDRTRRTLSHITDAYFNGKDFDKVDILKETYSKLCSNIGPKDVSEYALFGLDVRSLIIKHGYLILELFKLILLERKVLFYLPMCHELCHLILSLLSLFPQLIEHGLKFATWEVPHDRPEDYDDALNASSEEMPPSSPINEAGVRVELDGDCSNLVKLKGSRPVTLDELLETDKFWTSDEIFESEVTAQGAEISIEDSDTLNEANQSTKKAGTNAFDADSIIKSVSNASYSLYNKVRKSVSQDSKLDTSAYAATAAVGSQSQFYTDVVNDECDNDLDLVSTLPIMLHSFPLCIFTNKSMLNPYVPTIEIDKFNNDGAIRSFVIGSTNQLFIHKKWSDVVVSKIDSATFSCNVRDPQLKKQMSLTSADRRFFANVRKVIKENSTGDHFRDTEFNGSDTWIREQFENYLLSLLWVAARNDSNFDVDYGEDFMKAYRKTYNFRIWSTTMGAPSIIEGILAESRSSSKERADSPNEAVDESKETIDEHKGRVLLPAYRPYHPFRSDEQLQHLTGDLKNTFDQFLEKPVAVQANAKINKFIGSFFRSSER